MKLGILDTPEQLFKAIPQDVPQNIAFRSELHTALANDKKLQSYFISLCKADPKIFFNSTAWTLNPRLKPGFRNRPFILWGGQEPAVDLLHQGHEQRFDIVVHKSRDEGATEVIRTYINFLFLVDEHMLGLVGSLKADSVDKSVIIDSEYHLSGGHRSLFYKLCYGVVTLPQWWRPRVTKNYMHLENLENGSAVDGDSTSTNFGLGDRRDVILLDEIGCVDYSTAETMIANIPDVCDFNIYNSTHHFGPGHPYDQLLQNSGIHVVRLLWHQNPKKRIGLYSTPDIGYITIHDLDYYKVKYPKYFNSVQQDVTFRLDAWKAQIKAAYPDDEKVIDEVRLIADGGIQFGKLRSAWFDHEAIDRRGNSQVYVAQNILGDAGGSGQMTFTSTNLEMIKRQFIKPPKFSGELEYTVDKDGYIATSKFTSGFEDGRLKWWGELFNGRPNPSHKYVLAIDPSRGTGAANAAVGIYDVNTDEEVGKWVCPNTPEERLADVVWALRKWVNDNPNRVYIIWEANGAGAFENKIIWHGCVNYYAPRPERARVNKKKQNKRGWWSNTQAKHDLLRELDVALGRGLEAHPTYKYLRIYDAATVKEMESYVTTPTGLDCPTHLVAEGNGARAAHGDRVIPPALYILYRRYLSPSTESVKTDESIIMDSIAKRIEASRKASRNPNQIRFPYAGRIYG